MTNGQNITYIMFSNGCLGQKLLFRHNYVFCSHTVCDPKTENGQFRLIFAYC